MKDEQTILTEILECEKRIKYCLPILKRGYNKNVFKTLCSSRERANTLKWVLK